ncbi:MAG TPA: hypothetical protein VFT74_09100 [Isosphaeraceae bacterium]|nr:hypothetical protein [Isosphaeraceae bacterium]
MYRTHRTSEEVHGGLPCPKACLTPGRVPALARTEATEGNPKTVRDFALLRLLGHLGLRGQEAVGVDIVDLEPPGRTVVIVGKDQTEPVRARLGAGTAVPTA